MSGVLNVILTHQPRAGIENVLAWWSRYSPPENILVAYGGTEEGFKNLPEVQRVFISDPRLRVKDLQREKQSYGGLWRGVSRWLLEHP
jgi:hypothetical protein